MQSGKCSLSTDRRHVKLLGREELVQAQGEIEAGLRCHPDAEVRYFGSSRQAPRVTFYRDSAALCPRCQAVWLLLEAKRIDYVVVKENLPAYGERSEAFQRKVPRGALPAVEVDGRWATDSLDAMFLLERVFPNPEKPMIPGFSRLRGRAIELLELQRAVHSAWCNYLFRAEMSFFNEPAVDFAAALGQVQTALERNSDTPWFLPYEHPTIVDIQYVCMVERVVASAFFYKGMDVRADFPAIDRWLQAFEEIPWYLATRGDFYSLCMALEPAFGAPQPSPMRKVDLDKWRQLLPENYRLPFALRRDVEPLTKAEASSILRRPFVEAAWKLVQNHDKVARYCCRAMGGEVGAFAWQAPTRSRLADPQAAIVEGILEPLDALLCSVAEMLFQEAPVEDLRLRMQQRVQAYGIPEKLRPRLASCLAYLRDRIGVPRDLPLPAAKMLRAYVSEAYTILRRCAKPENPDTSHFRQTHEGRRNEAPSMAFKVTLLHVAVLVLAGIRFPGLRICAVLFVMQLGGAASSPSEDAAFAFHIPDLEHIKEAFESLDPDSNKSYETQAQESIAKLVNSVKRPVPEEVKEESKSFLAKGQTCKRKCEKEMKRHLGNTCEHLEFRVQEAKKVQHAHLIESTENVLKICKQSEKHHQEHCKWRCWREVTARAEKVCMTDAGLRISAVLFVMQLGGAASSPSEDWEDAAFAFHIPDLEHIKEAFESLDPDSNKSYETQAQESIAKLVNSVKRPVPEAVAECGSEVKEESKSFLAKGQTCKRKCEKEMKRHLGNTCEHLEFRVQEAKKVQHAHLIESTENVLKICKQSRMHWAVELLSLVHHCHCYLICPSQPEPRIAVGTVTSYDAVKGFGFLKVDGIQGDVFFPRSELPPELREEDKKEKVLHKVIEFEVKKMPDGKLRARKLLFLHRGKEGLGQRTRGRVAKYHQDKGYGFLDCEYGDNVFFLRSSLPKDLNEATFEELQQLEISFQIYSKEQGKPRAQNLEIVGRERREERPQLQGGEVLVGEIVTFEPGKGFGFVRSESCEEDVYFVRAELPPELAGAERKEEVVGERVEFEATDRVWCGVPCVPVHPSCNW
ncbi:unnamed protein product [Symbiodinium natans]|uniref:GST N-terminal domain-containing protein n=1 Tax=Symbiodinium natans TaxID=878477 RepID=A0A812KI55_9DINO|nr:unnamed protein product [Symbiodinium natans]